MKLDMVCKLIIITLVKISHWIPGKLLYNIHVEANPHKIEKLTPPLAICVAVGNCVVASPEKMFTYIEEALLPEVIHSSQLKAIFIETKWSSSKYQGLFVSFVCYNLHDNMNSILITYPISCPARMKSFRCSLNIYSFLKFRHPVKSLFLVWP